MGEMPAVGCSSDTKKRTTKKNMGRYREGPSAGLKTHLKMASAYWHTWYVGRVDDQGGKEVPYIAASRDSGEIKVQRRKRGRRQSRKSWTLWDVLLAKHVHDESKESAPSLFQQEYSPPIWEYIQEDPTGDDHKTVHTPLTYTDEEGWIQLLPPLPAQTFKELVVLQNADSVIPEGDEYENPPEPAHVSQVSYFDLYKKEYNRLKMQHDSLIESQYEPIEFVRSMVAEGGVSSKRQCRSEKLLHLEEWWAKNRCEMLRRPSLSPFDKLTRYRSKLLSKLDEVVKKARSAKTLEAIKTGESKISELVTRLKKVNDQIFAHFSTVIGVKADAGVHFDKKLFDVSMEDCFGTLKKEGTGIFTYPGLCNVNINKKGHNVEKVFSLYLSRKILTQAHPDDLIASQCKFLDMVSTPIDESTRTPSDRSAAYAFMQALCRVIFDAQGSVRQPYCSGKACYERSVAEGGKRSETYLYNGSSKYEGRGRVASVPILSAGKIRVITKDSAFNTRFAWLNSYMADRVRKAKWSIFGRELSSWFSQSTIFLNKKKSDYVVSGDLESATDTFDPEFARIAIRRLCEIYPPETFGLSSYDELYRELCSFTCDAAIDDPFAPRTKGQTGEPTRQQKRGQLMGSLLSFPVLCLVNLTSFLVFRKEGEIFMEKYLKAINASKSRLRRKYMKEAYRYIMDLDICGINGDDLIFCGNDEDIEAWNRGVAAVGGIVSRGKTLKNRRYGTVNSEIVDSENKSDPVMKTLRPSLAMGLSDGRYRCPHSSWERYLNSPLRSHQADDIFKPGSLFPGCPKFFGGFGTQKATTIEEFPLVDFMRLIALRPTAVYDYRDVGTGAQGVNSSAMNPAVSINKVQTKVRLDDVIAPHNVPLPAGGLNMVKGIIKRADLKVHLRKKYGRSPTTVMWSLPTYAEKTMEQVEEEVYSSLKYMRAQEVLELWDLYNAGWKLDEGDFALFEGEDPEVDVKSTGSVLDLWELKAMQSYKDSRKCVVIRDQEFKPAERELKRVFIEQANRGKHTYEIPVGQIETCEDEDDPSEQLFYQRPNEPSRDVHSLVLMARYQQDLAEKEDKERDFFESRDDGYMYRAVDALCLRHRQTQGPSSSFFSKFGL